MSTQIMSTHLVRSPHDAARLRRELEHDLARERVPGDDAGRFVLGVHEVALDLLGRRGTDRLAASWFVRRGSATVLVARLEVLGAGPDHLDASPVRASIIETVLDDVRLRALIGGGVVEVRRSVRAPSADRASAARRRGRDVSERSW